MATWQGQTATVATKNGNLTRINGNLAKTNDNRGDNKWKPDKDKRQP